MKKVSIIGAGLAGTEAALQLIKHGYEVCLYEKKQEKETYLENNIYKMDTFAELVCNNSLGPCDENTPLGRLYQELNGLNSCLISIAEQCRVDDKGYYAIDKEMFSKKVTEMITKVGIGVMRKEISEIPNEVPLIIATGPLTNQKLAFEIANVLDVKQYFFSDASCSIVDIDSINISNPFIKKISEDLYAVHIPRDIFGEFEKKLANGIVACDLSLQKEGYDNSYVNCLSIENLARKGNNSLEKTRFSHKIYESDVPVLLLRRENGMKNGFIMVGCTTMLRHGEQDKIFSMLPGFENFKMLKYGRMHRNTYFSSPGILDHFYKCRNKDIYLLGQLSGIDGYLPAISSGYVAAYRIIHGEKSMPFPDNSMIGALANYVSNENVVDFKPMCASFSLFNDVENMFSIKELSIHYSL